MSMSMKITWQVLVCTLGAVLLSPAAAANLQGEQQGLMNLIKRPYTAGNRAWSRASTRPAVLPFVPKDGQPRATAHVVTDADGRPMFRLPMALVGDSAGVHFGVNVNPHNITPDGARQKSMYMVLKRLYKADPQADTHGGITQRAFEAVVKDQFTTMTAPERQAFTNLVQWAYSDPHGYGVLPSQIQRVIMEAPQRGRVPNAWYVREGQFDHFLLEPRMDHIQQSINPYQQIALALGPQGSKLAGMAGTQQHSATIRHKLGVVPFKRAGQHAGATLLFELNWTFSRINQGKKGKTKVPTLPKVALIQVAPQAVAASLKDSTYWSMTGQLMQALIAHGDPTTLHSIVSNIAALSRKAVSGAQKGIVDTLVGAVHASFGAAGITALKNAGLGKGYANAMLAAEILGPSVPWSDIQGNWSRRVATLAATGLQGDPLKQAIKGYLPQGPNGAPFKFTNQGAIATTVQQLARRELGALASRIDLYSIEALAVRRWQRQGRRRVSDAEIVAGISESLTRIKSKIKALPLGKVTLKGTIQKHQQQAQDYALELEIKPKAGGQNATFAQDVEVLINGKPSGLLFYDASRGTLTLGYAGVHTHIPGVKNPVGITITKQGPGTWSFGCVTSGTGVNLGYDQVNLSAEASLTSLAQHLAQ